MRRSASAQTVISLARPLGPVAALRVPARAVVRGAATSAAFPSILPRRTSRTALRTMGSPADSTVNGLLFTPLLRYGLESVDTSIVCPSSLRR